jgi:hypothetical protein
VHKPQRITWISDHRRKLLGDREPLRENHHPTVRSDSSCDLLAGNGWKGERKKPIVGHGGCGSARSSELPTGLRPTLEEENSKPLANLGLLAEPIRLAIVPWLLVFFIIGWL